MEQYIIKQIEEFLAEHPEARTYVEAAWGLGFNAAAEHRFQHRLMDCPPEPVNPFKEVPV